jgi:hypothetical protein
MIQSLTLDENNNNDMNVISLTFNYSQMEWRSVLSFTQCCYYCHRGYSDHRVFSGLAPKLRPKLVRLHRNVDDNGVIGRVTNDGICEALLKGLQTRYSSCSVCDGLLMGK